MWNKGSFILFVLSFFPDCFFQAVSAYIIPEMLCQLSCGHSKAPQIPVMLLVLFIFVTIFLNLFIFFRLSVASLCFGISLHEEGYKHILNVFSKPLNGTYHVPVHGVWSSGKLTSKACLVCYFFPQRERTAPWSRQHFSLGAFYAICS